MITIKPPAPIPFIDTEFVFLAGSIEQGIAGNWQAEVESSLLDLNGIILNPRRDAWDSSWVQDISNPQFHEQVSWELEGLEVASTILVYFDPNTKSPITLLELGLITRFPGKVIVCCPDGFWRKGNVDIVCERYNIKTATSLEDLIDWAVHKIKYGLDGGLDGPYGP